ncbi:hypothetical protein Tco_0956898 [Tanacetum coccineum]
MMGNRSWLKNFMKMFIGTARFGNDHFVAIIGYGDYVIGDSMITRPPKHFGCGFFLWKETRLRELMSSPGAPSYSAGHSTPPSYSSGPSTPPSYSSGPSTPTNYSLGSSRNRECSNCKHLRGKISVLKATMEMHMHPEQHTVNSAALFHEVLNEMEKLDLE